MADATRRALVAQYDLSKSCLLVIDMQREGCDRKGNKSVEETLKLEQLLLPLIKAYKAKGLPVLFPQNGYERSPEDNRRYVPRHQGLAGDGSTILLGSEGFRLLPDLEALAEPEDCIVKKHYDCFSETGLADRLRKLGVTTVLITGVKADVCCLSSASGAIANDFDIVWVRDGVYTKREHLGQCAEDIMTFYGPVKTVQELVDGVGSSVMA